MVDLFQSFLLPGYALYLGTERLKISDSDISTHDTMKNAFEICSRYSEIQRLRQDTHMKSAFILDNSYTPTEVQERNGTQQRSFGETIRADTTVTNSKQKSESKTGKQDEKKVRFASGQSNIPRGAALTSDADHTRSSVARVLTRKPNVDPD